MKTRANWLGKKCEIVQQLWKYVSIIYLINNYNIPRTTINYIKRDANKTEDFIIEIVVNGNKIISRKKSTKLAVNNQLDKASLK